MLSLSLIDRSAPHSITFLQKTKSGTLRTDQCRSVRIRASSNKNMASLVRIKSLINPLCSRQNGILSNFVRNKVTTNDDWKPGPYPVTEEERRKAAEKYGMCYEEYKPYPDDGFGHGDYPMLPMKGVALRDPYYPYDFPDEKRNFCEPIHAEINILGEDRADFGEKPPVPYRTATLVMTLVFGSFFAIHYLMRPYPNFRPALAKQFPKPGEKHYTFEPAH